jgi:hypothetical protein
MKKYEIYDFCQGEYVGADRYYYTEAKNPIEAIKNYMRENKLSGKIVRTVTDTNTRFIVRNRNGSYLYQLIAE